MPQHCRNHHDKHFPSPQLKNMFNCIFENFCVPHSLPKTSLHTGLQDTQTPLKSPHQVQSGDQWLGQFLSLTGLWTQPIIPCYLTDSHRNCATVWEEMALLGDMRSHLEDWSICPPGQRWAALWEETCSGQQTGHCLLMPLWLTLQPWAYISSTTKQSL